MNSIQCLGCLKIMEVEVGKEKLKWFHHSSQTKCQGSFSFYPFMEDVQIKGSLMRNVLEVVSFEEHEFVDVDNGENSVAGGVIDEVPVVTNVDKIILGDFDDEIYEIQKKLALMGVIAFDKFTRKLRRSNISNAQLPIPEAADLMEILKFGVECRLSDEEGDRLMRLLNTYTIKHSAKVGALPATWKTIEDCIEECTQDVSFLKRYERPLDARFFGDRIIGKPDELLQPFVGFMLNLHVVVGKMFLEMDLADFEESFASDCSHVDSVGDHDRILSDFSTGDLAKKFAEAHKNYVYEVAEGEDDIKPVDVFINISFDETSVSKVGTASLTPTYFSIMNCNGKSYKYEVGGYIPYKLPHDLTTMKVRICS